MNQNDINRIVDELERRGFAPQQQPAPKQSNGMGGFLFLFLIIVALAGWAIFSQDTPPIQGNSNPVVIQPTQEYTITESEAVFLATSTPLVYPTAVLPTVTTDHVQPMLQATLAGEWPRPITPQQYDWCVLNPDINPVCEDYLK